MELQFGLKRIRLASKHKHNLALGEKMVKGRVKSHRAELRTLETILNMHTKEGFSPTAIA